MQNTSKDPLHGVTLQMMLEKLVDFYGFDTLSELIKIKCFSDNPSIKSSLTFLRKTPWARAKVEALYLRSLPKFGR
ncbi:MAG TPA: VF530 family protein [Flavobacterium sp.]|nr:VF530 family protein [Flavobacterium sp.]HPJ10775.1 VF530 family protein [Flavobacterium sp.]